MLGRSEGEVIPPLRTLPRELPATSESPGLLGAQHRSRGLLQRFHEGDPSAVRGLREEYDAQADGWPEWVAGQPDYVSPLVDALNRGLGPVAPGLVVEVGAGSGNATDLLLAHFPMILSVDISLNMLRSARTSLKACADVRALPLPDGTVSLVVGLNAVPDWAEFRRVLAPGGQVLWASSFGEQTPLYTTPEQVARAFPDREVVTSVAGHGDWSVVMAHHVPS